MEGDHESGKHPNDPKKIIYSMPDTELPEPLIPSKVPSYPLYEPIVKPFSISMPQGSNAETSEDLILRAARVSSATPDSLKPGLLGYLMKNAHWSPLEMSYMGVEVITTRAMARQIIRHSFDIQEFSQRYKEVNNDMFCILEARRQDTTNRQNSIDDMDPEIVQEWYRRQSEVLELVQKNYEWALEKGIAKECARVILPEGNTMTRLFLVGNARLWYHYLQLRLGNGTQREHMQIAEKIKVHFCKCYPHLAKQAGWIDDI